MKVDKHEDLKSVQAIEAKIWLIFDALRAEGSSGSTQDYQVILLLLSAYKDGLFTSIPTAESEEWLSRIDQALEEDGIKHIQSHGLFGNYIVEALKRMKVRPLGFRHIIKLIQAIDKSLLAEHFNTIFDAILYRIAKSAGRMGGEYLQPMELTQLMLELGELPKNGRVYNPFAGLASFAVLLKPTQTYFGQELNPDTWMLGTMRLHAHKPQRAMHYVCANTFTHWPDSEQQYDLIVANPPMGLLPGKKDNFAAFGFNTLEQFFIENALDSVSDSGKIVALFAHGWLFKGNSDRALRQRLIEEDLIDMIISMPGGLLKNTGIPFVIVVISRQKQLPGKVRFVKADNFVETNAAREKVLNYADLMHLIREQSEDSSSLVTVDTAEITANDYNLNVPRYFQKDTPIANAEQLVKLKEILLLVKGHKMDLPDTGRLLRIRDLKDDKLDFKLDVEKIEEVVLFDSKAQKLAETTLLLATRWRSLKPTLFEFGGQVIYKSPDILAFKVNEALVDYGYLINELHAEYVQQQLDAYRYGTVVPSIRKEDLLEVAIKLPSLQEQKAKVKGIHELSYEIRLLQEKLEAQMVGESEAQYQKDSSLKHRLGTPLMNIGSSLRNIERALSRKFEGWEQVKVSETKQVTLKESFDSIQQMLQTIHAILTAGEKEIDFSNRELAPIHFLAFIIAYVNQVKASEKGNVTTHLDIHPELEEQFDKVVMVNANTELLEIALNAIVENANKHGFVDDSKHYKLEFKISLFVSEAEKVSTQNALGDGNTFVKVEVANNGKAFPDNFSLDKLIMKNRFAGETGNTGQGGHDLNEIIKFHNGGISTLQLISGDVVSEFTTTYSFLLPIIG